MPILVVDDEPFFLSSVSTILRKAGFQTLSAGDGIEAFHLVRAIGAGIELLLTDLQMPRMDGLSLIASVRELHPHMPVLLMTGSRLEDRPRSYATLQKPFGREGLLTAVRNALAAAKAEKPIRKVDVFTNGSCCSEKLITAIRAAACPYCEISVLDVTAADIAEQANQLGVRSVPAVAINGELVCCPCECGPDLTKLRAAGLGMPRS